MGVASKIPPFRGREKSGVVVHVVIAAGKISPFSSGEKSAVAVRLGAVVCPKTSAKTVDYPEDGAAYTPVAPLYVHRGNKFAIDVQTVVANKAKLSCDRPAELLYIRS